METKTTSERSKYLFLSGLFIGIILLGVGIFALLENTSSNKYMKDTILTKEFIEDIFGEGFLEMSDVEKIDNDLYFQYELLLELEDKYLNEVKQTEDLLVKLVDKKGITHHDFYGSSLKELRGDYVKDIIKSTNTPNELADNYLNFTTYMVYEMLKEFILLNDLIEIDNKEFQNYLQVMYGYDEDISEEDDLINVVYKGDYLDKLILKDMLIDLDYINKETTQNLIKHEGNVRQKVINYVKTGTDFEDIVDLDKEIDEFVTDVQTFLNSFPESKLEDLYNYLTKQKNYNEKFITFQDIVPYEVYKNGETFQLEEHLFETTSEYKGDKNVRVIDNPYILSVSIIYDDYEITDKTLEILDTISHLEQGLFEFDDNTHNLLNYLQDRFQDNITYTKNLKTVLKNEYDVSKKITELVEKVFLEYQTKLIEYQNYKQGEE